MAEIALESEPSIRIQRWGSERPLRLLIVLAALLVWALLLVSLLGIVYVALIGLFFFVAHLAFIAHLRGSAVRLGPEQMPELYDRVQELSRRVGLRKAPDAYIVQAGGILNALATKFLGSNFIVLYSDLLEACGDNTEARDFIIAHELGHIHAGHLRWRWLLLPGLIVPFLGTAYSRACEYTCDRYGLGASRDPERALDGLCILAAGGKHGPEVNRRALVSQRRDMNSLWMKIGEWLSTHPPIADRVAVLQPSLAEGIRLGSGASLGAAAVLLLAVLVPTVATYGVYRGLWPQIQAALQAQQGGATAGAAAAPETRAQIETEIMSLVAAAEVHRNQAGAPPASADELYSTWSGLNPGAAEPRDPFDGERYGYELEEGDYVIWSVGADPADSADDLYYSSAGR